MLRDPIQKTEYHFLTHFPRIVEGERLRFWKPLVPLVGRRRQKANLPSGSLETSNKTITQVYVRPTISF